MLLLFFIEIYRTSPRAFQTLRHRQVVKECNFVGVKQKIQSSILPFTRFTVTLSHESSSDMDIDKDVSQKEASVINKNTSPKPPEKKRRGPSLLFNLSAMGGILIVVFVLVSFALNVYTRHDEEIIVPNIKGIPSGAAVRKLESMGLRTTVDDSVYVKALMAGAIYEQSIQPGDKVKEGRLIHLTINSGSAPQLILPDIADNSSLREATTRLISQGFKLGPVEYMKGEKDWVYEVKCHGRNIGAGSRVNAEDLITIVVGDGTYYDEDTNIVGDSAEQSSFGDAEDLNAAYDE